MPSVKTPSASKPGLSDLSPTKLRTNSPAPASSIMERATSPTSRALRVRPASREDKVLTFSKPPTSIPDDRSAGINPNNSALAAEAPIVNTSTPAFSPTLESRGISFGPKRTMASSAQCANSRLAPPASSASSRPSVKTCRTSLKRPAPNARRIASSRCRTDVRASSKLETLAQAISATRPTATSSTSSAGRTSPTSALLQRSAVTPHFSSLSG